jgi:hypothetical protein
MCVRPGSESPTEELDETLWELFMKWKAHASVRPGTDGDGVEEFCSCVQARLEKMVKERWGQITPGVHEGWNDRTNPDDRR